MNFFEQQDQARKKTTRLLVLFGIACVGLIAALYLFAVGIGVVSEQRGFRVDREGIVALWHPVLLLGISVGTLAIVGLGSLYKTASLSGGGLSIAKILGARPLDPNTKDLQEKRLLNIVEEMAIASGIPVPTVVVIEEKGINAFAAGWTPNDAVVGVTRGCLELLNRDELQGVVAHEFSHVFNGDMKLNLRLIGVLHGILIIGMTGLWIMRGAGRVRGKNAAQAALAMLVVGGALALIGYTGVFLGRLIKAAVSREREYLADASAVQFTRNPDGIAGALKKIGGLQTGSQLLATRGAEQASHLFFADAVKKMTSGLRLTATHPPLHDRIKRIDPNWSGEFPKIAPPAGDARPGAAPHARPTPAMPGVPGIPGMPQLPGGIPNLPGMPGTVLGLSPDEVVAQVGAPTSAHLEYSAALVGSIPGPLRESARDPFKATAVVFALLLDTNPAARDPQVEILRTQNAKPLVDETLRQQAYVAAIPTEARLALLDLCIPALKQAGGFDSLLKTVKALIETDQTVSPYESSVLALLHHRLEAAAAPKQAAKATFHSLSPLKNETAMVLSLLAWAGQASAGDASRAYESGARRLASTVQGLRAGPFPKEQCTSSAFDASVQRLVHVVPAAKQRLIDAAAYVVLADRQVSQKEAELLRAVANALDCPMPPLAPTAPAGAKTSPRTA